MKSLVSIIDIRRQFGFILNLLLILIYNVNIFIIYERNVLFPNRTP